MKTIKVTNYADSQPVGLLHLSDIIYQHLAASAAAGLPINVSMRYSKSPDGIVDIHTLTFLATPASHHNVLQPQSDQTSHNPTHSPPAVDHGAGS